MGEEIALFLPTADAERAPPETQGSSGVFAGLNRCGYSALLKLPAALLTACRADLGLTAAVRWFAFL